MKKLLLLSLVAVIGAVGRTAPAETAPASLSELFKPGVMFQDRNGDGAIDFVDARFVLPEQPSAGELAAASDIAARVHDSFCCGVLGSFCCGVLGSFCCGVHDSFRCGVRL